MRELNELNELNGLGELDELEGHGVFVLSVRPGQIRHLLTIANISIL